jgi:DNA polymerase III alpha subunit (gram-positive type)
MYHEFKKENEITLDIANIIYNDTLPFSKRLYPGRTYYNQPSLARTFNIMVDGAHRAMADVIVLEQLYTRLLNDLRIKEKVDGFKEPEKVRDYISFSTKY